MLSAPLPGACSRRLARPFLSLLKASVSPFENRPPPPLPIRKRRASRRQAAPREWPPGAVDARFRNPPIPWRANSLVIQTARCLRVFGALLVVVLEGRGDRFRPFVIFELP